MQTIDFPLRGEFITLDALLKATGLAGSGGAAKALVADGKVQVDGQDESRKTCKLRIGQVVSVHGARVKIVEPLPQGEAPSADETRGVDGAAPNGPPAGASNEPAAAEAFKPAGKRKAKDTLEIFRR